MELPHHLVGHILEKLPVKSLLRFKSVSVQWKSTIESGHFKKKHLVCRQSQDPDILLISPLEFSDLFGCQENVTRSFTMDSSDLIRLPNLCPSPNPIHLDYYPVPLVYYYVVSWSCDGMICYYTYFNGIYVVNPITRWFRSVPQARYQTVLLDTFKPEYQNDSGIFWKLGFGKDEFTDTYKLVWLYNSSDFGLENATTCEVFDFSTNSWRYVTAASSRILDEQIPVYLNGLLHWFTDERRILSFDLHTKTFHIISKTPLFHEDSQFILMFTLDNRLCISQKTWPIQEIWSLNKSEKTWERKYLLNLQTDSHLFAEEKPYILYEEGTCCAIPVMVLKNKKNKNKKKQSLVLYDARSKNPNLMVYDPESRSYDICFSPNYKVHYLTIAVSYFPSLISIV